MIRCQDGRVQNKPQRPGGRHLPSRPSCRRSLGIRPRLWTSQPTGFPTQLRGWVWETETPPPPTTTPRYDSACLPIQSGPAVRDPPEGGRPADGLAVPPGEPAGHAELPQPPRGGARPHLPGRAGAEHEPQREHGVLGLQQPQLLPDPSGEMRAPRTFLSVSLCPGNEFPLETSNSGILSPLSELVGG